MDPIDETDREILRLLLEDARRPYSDIADRVGLSGPAVSDRIEALRERGIVRRYTVDLDRSLLGEESQLLATVEVDPDEATRVYRSLREQAAVEHVFRTVDARLVATMTVPGGDVTRLLSEADVLEAVRGLDVRLLADEAWSPGLDRVEFAPACAECGNTVDEEGTTAAVDDDRHYFCCSSCERNFLERYDDLRDAADT